MSTKGIILGIKAAGTLGWKPCKHSSADWLEILGASNSCSPKGLSRPLHG